MPAKRLSMRKIKEVLRLCWGQSLSKRQTARSCGLSRPTVTAYLRRAEAAGLSWPLAAELDDGALERLLFPLSPALPDSARGVPDWSAVHRELKCPGVTLQLLWHEYRQTHPQGYQYTWFCRHYRAWAGKLDLVMRQAHRAGEKLLSIMPVCVPRSSTRQPGKSVRQRCLWPRWAHRTTPMPRPPGPRGSRTGPAPMVRCFTW